MNIKYTFAVIALFSLIMHTFLLRVCVFSVYKLYYIRDAKHMNCI